MTITNQLGQTEAPPETFADVLAVAADPKRGRGPSIHADLAERFAAVAAELMAEQLAEGRGTHNPPHALRFAEMHAAIALAQR